MPVYGCIKVKLLARCFASHSATPISPCFSPLQDYIGEDKVNNALRSFLEEYRYAEPPYPVTTDFFRHLEPQVPDSLQYLITDWFKEITLYDLRVEDVEGVQENGSNYDVTFTVSARKLKADTLGNETPVPTNDWIDIGLFNADEDSLLVEQRVKITAETQTFTLSCTEEPAKVAIDPRRLLVERVTSDNIKRVN